MKGLSRLTKLYLLLMYITGTFLLLRGLSGLKITEPLLFAILCVLGSFFHILKVEGTTNRSHYTISFLVFGFALLHWNSPLALIVIVVSNVAEWVWNRPPWFIQLFNISCYMVAAQIAIFVYTLINPLGVSTSWQIILAIGLGMASFTFINHLVIGVVVWLARGENFKQSGIFDPIPLLIDLTMLMVGASLALVWNYNPFALFIFLVPAYPLYMALKIPALERKTEIDQKTELYNHQYFMTQFKNELQRANRYDRPVSIIMADLDLLRNINNTYGHLAGDEVLKGVADILKQTVRDYDIVARFGGEEFAVLMAETEIEKAIERAEYIRKTIESASFVIPTSVDPIKVTMSFGISKRESVEQSTEEILHHADTALYRSKLSGRNRSLAYINNSFLSVDSAASEQATEESSGRLSSSENSEVTSEYQAVSIAYHNRTPETEKHLDETVHDSIKVENVKKSHASDLKVYNYITLLTLFALFALFATRHLLLTSVLEFSSANLFGFAAIAMTIVSAESLSINLYIRNTSLSTSAVPILALMILFGPLGTIAASTILAVTAAIKYRSPFNRLIFNLSNHIIAGILINLLVHSIDVNIRSWEKPLLEPLIVLAASLILFAVTTILISVGIGIDLKQSFHGVWREQYQWMAPYYLGVGFMALALIFGYIHAGLLGIVTMIIPLTLLRFSQAQYVEHTRVVVNDIRRKNQELEKSTQEIHDLNEGLLTTLSDIIDLQDANVLGHSKQVSKYACEIGRLLELSEKQIDLVRQGGLLHDIGKLGISKDVLMKPGKLSPNEYEIIKKHAALGADLIKNSPSLRCLAPIIHHHHEFMNGDGYPDKISGNQIPIESRIIAVADAIEAMLSDRPYRKALKPQEVVAELNRCSGIQFDPLVVTASTRMLAAAIASENISPDQAESEKALPVLKVKIQTS